MRNNIKYNLIQDNYFIINNNKLYVDYNDTLNINIFGSNCKNLSLTYSSNSESQITNDSINRLVYYDDENKHIIYNQDNGYNLNTNIFNTDTKYSGFPRITPAKYINSGSWKTTNDDYISNEINSIYVEYPINLLSPKSVVLENTAFDTLRTKTKTKLLSILNTTEYVLEFDIDIPLFDKDDVIKVYLIPVNPKLKRMFCVTNKMIYTPEVKKYTSSFSPSIFYDSRYDKSNTLYKIEGDKYYVALQSSATSKIYFSDPSKYIFVTNTVQYKLIDFKLNIHSLNYCTSKNKDILLYFYVCGLKENTYFNIRISDLNIASPIYISPDILFTGDTFYYQNVLIPLNINNKKYTVELVYNNDSICDLTSYIDVDIDYNSTVYILNIDDISNVTYSENETKLVHIKLYVHEKFINSLVNISLNNIFLQNIIITQDNYNNCELSVTIDSKFSPGDYYIRIQTSNENKYYAKSNTYIRINEVHNNRIAILYPNTGYSMIPYTSNPIYKSVKSNNKTFITPNGVTKIDFNIKYNKMKYTGKIAIQPNSIISVRSDDALNLVVNNISILLLGPIESLNKCLVDRIEDYSVKDDDTNENYILVNYICDRGYYVVVHTTKLEESLPVFLYVYCANNPHGNNLQFYKMVNVINEKNTSYFVLNEKTYFDFRGRMHFYVKDSLDESKVTLNMYVGYINMIEYPIQCSLLSNNHVVMINEVFTCKVLIQTTNVYFDIYFVDDLYGKSPYYLTCAVNNNGEINISFIYSKNDEIRTKYIMICSKDESYVIRKIINIPFTIQSGTTNIEDIINSEVQSNMSHASIHSNTTQVKNIIGVYTTFDTPPNKITPSNFLERFGLYAYNDITKLGNSYANYAGYLILQTDSLSNSISQTYTTLDSIVTYLVSQLANKKINVINVPNIFKYNFITTEFVSETHTFEYYNNTIYNNTLINIQNSLCLRVVQNNQLITDISTIHTNFLRAYNDEIRNYTGQNELNNQINAVSSLTSMSPRYAWIEDLGHYIGQYYDLSINNVAIEKITCDWMNIWNEISLPVGHKRGYNKMIGNVDELTNFTSIVKPKRQIKIPLKFYFNRYQNTGMSIPMIGLLHSDVKLTIQLDKLENLIMTDPLTKITSSGRPKLKLYLTYVYLDNEERKVFAQSKHEYLVEQQNYRSYSHSGTSFQTKINLSQPVKDLFWVAQPLQNISNKQYFNYTMSKFYRLPKNYDRYDEVNPVTQLSRKLFKTLYAKYPNVPYIPLYINGIIKDAPLPDYSAITESELDLNGQKRFDEERDLTTKINFMRYSNIPVSGINVYSFARYPTEYQPSGSCNFSQLGDAFVSLKTEPGDYSVKFIARNYNLLRIMGGQAGLAFEL
jgi:hypothetical protein